MGVNEHTYIIYETMLENRFLYVNGLAGSYLNKALQILCKIYKTTFKSTKKATGKET